MSTLFLARETNQALDTNSTYALYASALVLTLALLAFVLDLAAAPRRVTRAQSRTSEPVLARSGGGSTAVLEPGESGPADQRAWEGSAAGGEIGESGATPAGAPVRRQWAGIAMSLSWLGSMVLVAAIALRAASVQRPPLGNMYEFALCACAFTMAVFLVWSLKRDLRWLGAFVVAPVVLLQMLAALVFYTDATQLLPSLKSYWLSIHVSVATLSVGLFTVGFVLTVLHLVQQRREDAAARGAGKPGFMDALPKASSLDQSAYAVHIVAYPLWVFTLIAGAIWAQQAWGHYWNWDPKEVWSFVIFVVYTAYLHSRLTAGWNSKRVAYLAVAGFTCIVLNYTVVNFFFTGQHSYSGM